MDGGVDLTRKVSTGVKMRLCRSGSMMRDKCRSQRAYQNDKYVTLTQITICTERNDKMQQKRI